jgi:hypothetical protein
MGTHLAPGPSVRASLFRSHLGSSPGVFQPSKSDGSNGGGIRYHFPHRAKSGAPQFSPRVRATECPH